MCESIGKADLLPDQFDRLLICRSLAIHLLVLPPLPSGRERVRRLLLDLDPYGGTETLGMFPLFLKRTAGVMASVFV